ncbi:hypothetical protein PPACK8108_LOCUS3932 [Phakopsora pachyrhizi]|uniref:Uncharacterized protein n=1 Tax=Phakopsora pachyrhizi TaxID=170000 RepID=A0AAV0AKZ0_PHAPC|nr:hypothetical protein PPACK8108_LOCUS3932 [Phakopsora pachyrhizi]
MNPFGTTLSAKLSVNQDNIPRGGEGFNPIHPDNDDYKEDEDRRRVIASIRDWVRTYLQTSANDEVKNLSQPCWERIVEMIGSDTFVPLDFKEISVDKKLEPDVFSQPKPFSSVQPLKSFTSALEKSANTDVKENVELENPVSEARPSPAAIPMPHGLFLSLVVHLPFNTIRTVVKIQGIKPPNQSSIEQDDLVRLREDEDGGLGYKKTIEIDHEIHTGPGHKMPPGKGRRARWKAGKERHSKASECHASAIQAQGKYEKDKSLKFFSGDSEHNEDEEEEEEEDIDANEVNTLVKNQRGTSVTNKRIS